MRKDKGFGLVYTLVAGLVVVAIVVTGIFVYRHNHKATNSSSTSNTSSNTKGQVSNPYAGWKTYVDKGSTPTSGSGISVKYPSDWQVSVGDSRAYAWEIKQQVNPMEIVNARYVYLSASTTPRQEWDNCTSADACGPAPGDKKLSDNSSQINGLDTYSAKMQGSSGIYHVTVIKSNLSTSAGMAFVELILNSDDAAQLSVYQQIVASATFPN